ncbi:MAG: DUF47 family protein [Coriobacteriales bacterium]|jgi:predicted phosphate transport protein (TIGR00153 family)|nr:DUF47 family protein [Coriobacteriales bacterium]
MAKVRFDYFDAMVNQADYSCREAKMLVDVFRDFDPEAVPEQVEAMHELENAADSQNHELFMHIAKEFITPIDREDIIEMAHRLDDIVDYIEDVLQQVYMYNVSELHEKALPMAVLIERSTDSLYAALQEFRNFKKVEEMAKRIIAVNSFEEEADRLYSEATRDLFINHVDDPVFIITWSNIFTRMERCADACENVADMMATIVLKNN